MQKAMKNCEKWRVKATNDIKDTFKKIKFSNLMANFRFILL